MKLAITIFSSFIFLFIITSCEKETLDTGTWPKNMSFQTDILPMFQSCTDCHGAGSVPDFTVANAYSTLINGELVNTSAPENSELIKTLNGSAHSSFLNQDQKNKILGWINEGAQNN